MNNEFRKQFCKINNLPIKIFNSPVFEDRLELLDPIYNTKALLETFEREITEFKNIEEYLAFYNQFKENVIQHILNKPEYELFNSANMNVYKNDLSTVKKQSLYQPSRDGQYFLGFDLSQANFNAMKFFNKELVDKCDSYEDFIRQFTDKEHLIKSKYIRQVIFGTCNPSRQTTIEKYLMTFICDEILKKYEISDIVHFSEDEIVISAKNDDELVSNILNIADTMGFKIRNEQYKLIKIDGMDGYFKVFKDGTYKLKCANSLMVPFIIRKITDSELKESDKIFIHEGFQCKFVEIPNIQIPALKY